MTKRHNYYLQSTFRPEDTMGRVFRPTFEERGSINNVSPVRNTLAGYDNHPIDTVKSKVIEIGYRLAGGLGKTIRVKVEVLE